MSNHPDEIRLKHIQDATRKALQFAQGRSRADLDKDEMFALAMVRPIEIIGEAARNVTEETQARYPEVPWKQIAGTRDRLIHAYFEVNLDIVWEIIAADLPTLLDALS